MRGYRSPVLPALWFLLNTAGSSQNLGARILESAPRCQASDTTAYCNIDPVTSGNGSVIYSCLSDVKPDRYQLYLQKYRKELYNRRL